MVQNAQISRDNLVLEEGPRRDVDPVAVVGNDDDRSLRGGGVSRMDLSIICGYGIYMQAHSLEYIHNTSNIINCNSTPQ